MNTIHDSNMESIDIATVRRIKSRKHDTQFPCNSAGYFIQLVFVVSPLRTGRCPSGRPRHRLLSCGQILARVASAGVIIVRVERLHQLLDNAAHVVPEVFQIHDPPKHERHNEEDEEKNQHRKIENGKANNSSLPQFGLLQGINWRADLATAVKLDQPKPIDNQGTHLGRSQKRITEWNLSM